MKAQAVTSGRLGIVSWSRAAPCAVPLYDPAALISLSPNHHPPPTTALRHIPPPRADCRPPARLFDTPSSSPPIDALIACAASRVGNAKRLDGAADVPLQPNSPPTTRRTLAHGLCRRCGLYVRTYCEATALDGFILTGLAALPHRCQEQRDKDAHRPPEHAHLAAVPPDEFAAKWRTCHDCAPCVV